MTEIVAIIGAGQIGQAIARRVGVGKHLLSADVSEEHAGAAAEVLGNIGYDVSIATVDVSSRQGVHALVEAAAACGDVTGLIHAAGVSPSPGTPDEVATVGAALAFGLQKELSDDREFHGVDVAYAECGFDGAHKRE